MGEKRYFRLLDQPTRRMTSICLEIPFWKVLEQMAEEAELTLSQLISHIDTSCNPENGNLTSSLRVICLRWSANEAVPKPNADTAVCYEYLSTDLS